MSERVKWMLSPSKLEASKGCACFEENPFEGAEYKDRGTDLHEIMEKDLPTTGLESNDADAIDFCRNAVARLIEAYGPAVLDIKELSVQPCELYPRGKLDRVILFMDGHLVVLDYKFGVMPVPPAELNAQVQSYVLMAYHEINKNASDYYVEVPLPSIERITGGIIQPAEDLIDLHEFSVDQLPGFAEEIRAANDRVTYPFKQPDASDPDKCKRCKWLGECPAITGAVTKFVDRLALLPTPEVFDPTAMVRVEDRVLAQDLAGVFEAWAKMVKANNKEYALANGGTLGGVYNVSTRSNGFTVTDTQGFLEHLVKEGVLDSIEDGIKYLNVTKTRFVDGLTEIGLTPKAEVAEAVSQAIEACGEPKAPVVMIRRGGKKQIQQVIDEGIIAVPQLQLPPWMSKTK